MRTSVAVVLVVLFLNAVPAFAQKKRGLVWNQRPSLVFGENVKVDLRGRVQLDWRRFDPPIAEDTFDPRTMRVGLKGDLSSHIDFEIERAIERDGTWGDWKDVYVNWSTFNAFSIKGGRFKVPFGLEQNTGATDLDFVNRSRTSSTIAPGRDRGVMVYGRFLGRDIVYELGVFDGDGDNGRLTEPQFIEPDDVEAEVGPSYAGRATFRALSGLPVADALKSMSVGVAYTSADVPEGLNSLRGESVWGTKEYFEPVYVKGRRQRVGAQLDWTPGPLGFKAEWMQSREERVGQSNRNEDLSDVVSTGWYASGTWFLTGEDKDDNINPRKPLFRGGVGAVEIGARYDQLRFGSASTAGIPFTNPRADHLLANTDRVWTFGLNWMPNRWLRVMTNAIHESFEDASRTPINGTDRFWSGVVRLQVAF